MYIPIAYCGDKFCRPKQKKRAKKGIMGEETSDSDLSEGELAKRKALKKK